MAQTTRRNVRVVSIVISLLAASILIFGPMARVTAQQKAQGQAMKLAELKLKFDGAKSCGGKDCHDKAGATSPPAELGHEYTIWNDAPDFHRKAYDRLADKLSTDIAGKLKIAATSERCTSCHALAVPTELQGQKFNIKEGNSCGSCHGPSEKWLTPHSEKGWTDKQRAAKGTHQALLKDWGIYDTKPLVERAEICVSCHLSIDADLVTAGHPQPAFELDYFSAIQPPHWKDPGGFESTKIWLAGQVVAVEQSAKQAAARAAEAAPKQQAQAHQRVLAAATGAAGLDAASLKPKLKDWKADKATTLQMLTAVAAQPGMAKDCGKFGMQQQAWAISALFNAYARGEKIPDAQKDEINKLIDSKIMQPEKGDLKAEDYERGLAEVVAKLPKS